MMKDREEWERERGESKRKRERERESAREHNIAKDNITYNDERCLRI